MWNSKDIRDILPLIAKKLGTESLKMIWVCQYWRRILKPILSKEYPLSITNKNHNNKHNKGRICWDTIQIYHETSINLSDWEFETLKISYPVSYLNFNLFPKAIKTLVIFNLSESFWNKNLKVHGILPNIEELFIVYRMNVSLPYSLISKATKKLMMVIKDEEYYFGRSFLNIDFSDFNLTSYTYFQCDYINSPILRGDLSLLVMSYDTLETLKIQIDILGDLTKFTNLKTLHVRCNTFDKSLLPTSVLNLKIEVI